MSVEMSADGVAMNAEPLGELIDASTAVVGVGQPSYILG